MNRKLAVIALLACIAQPVWAEEEGVSLTDAVLDDPDAPSHIVDDVIPFSDFAIGYRPASSMAAPIDSPLKLATSAWATPAPGPTQTDAPSDPFDITRFQTKHQQLFIGLRGDAGLLGGFSFGRPTQQSALDRSARAAPAADSGS